MLSTTTITATTTNKKTQRRVNLSARKIINSGDRMFAPFHCVLLWWGWGWGGGGGGGMMCLCVHANAYTFLTYIFLPTIYN